MPRFTQAEYQAFLMRGKPRKIEISTTDEVTFDLPIKNEAQIHSEITKWCRNQVPAVPYIHSRMDRESTIAEGCQDFTVFYRSRCICVEVKTKTGKQSREQLAWAHLMASHGFTVHIVRSFQQFLELVNK